MCEYKQKSFTFWVSYFDTAFDLDDNERLAFYDTVLEYVFLGQDKEQSLKEHGMMNAYFAFKGIKANIKTSTARAENGAKGGRGKKQTESKNNLALSDKKANGKLNESKVKVKDKVKLNNIYAPCPRCGKLAERRKNTTCSYVCHECGWDGVIDD